MKTKLFLCFWLAIYGGRALAVPSQETKTDSVGIYLDSVRVLYESGLPDRALKMLDQIEIDPKDSMNQAYRFLARGVALSLTDKNEEAIIALNKSLTYDVSGKYKHHALFELAIIESKEGRSGTALSKMIDLYEQEEATGEDQHFLLEVLINIGSLYSRVKDDRKGLEYNLKALSLIDETTHGSVKAVVNLNTGVFLGNLGKTDSSIYFIKEAIKWAIEMGNDAILAYGYDNLADNYLDLKRYPEAIANARNASRLAKVLNMPRIIIDTEIIIARCMLAAGKYDEANSHGLEAVRMAADIKNPTLRSEGYLLLHEIDSSRGFFERSLVNFKKYVAINDSLINVETSKHIADLQEKFDAGQRENEILLLTSQNEAKEATLAQQKLRNYQLIAVIVILLIGFWLVYLTYQARQRKKWALVTRDFHRERLNAAIEAQELLQKKIARDLHDGVGQSLAALSLRFAQFTDGIKAQKEEINKELETSAQLLKQVVIEVRNISHVAMPYVLEEGGLPAAISEMAEKFIDGGPINFSFDHFNLKRYPEQIEINLYRILQELVSNALKHANAKSLNVQIYEQDETLICLVEDDGRGINLDAKRADGIGLMNVHSRVEVLHGTINFESNASDGTLITIRIPLCLN